MPRRRVRDHGGVDLDHLCYVPGSEGLASCVQRLGGRLGAAFTDGGLHPGFGTRNFVLPLTGGCYLEVVDVLDHPAVDRAPFGRAVRARSADGGGWLTWVVRVDDIADVEQRLARPAAEGHRRRPDGVDLYWRQIGLHDVALDRQLPFFVEWHVDPADHPSAGGSPVTLRRIEIAGDEAEVDAYLGTSNRQPFDGVDVAWTVPDEGNGLVAAVFDTAAGEVRID